MKASKEALINSIQILNSSAEQDGDTSAAYFLEQASDTPYLWYLEQHDYLSDYMGWLATN